MQRRLTVVVSSIGLLLSAGVLSRLSAGDDQDLIPFPDVERVRRGFDIAPVKLNLHNKNRALVGLGSYLVNAVGGCNDCHTCPSYDPANNPFKGERGAINVSNYLAGGVPFGPFTSRNLTPDEDEGNRPAGLTFAQFSEVLRTGIDLEKKHPEISPLLQVMPWPVYRYMSNLDIRAIYEYLRAVPAAKPGTCSGPGE